MTMVNVSIAEARSSLADIVKQSSTEPVFLERHGSRAAVLISPEQYEHMLDALEEIEDIAAFDAAISEEGDNIPWDQAKADLGW